jgi:hypothetical protein
MKKLENSLEHLDYMKTEVAKIESKLVGLEKQEQVYANYFSVLKGKVQNELYIARYELEKTKNEIKETKEEI